MSQDIKKQVLVRDLRETMKNTMENEIKKIPEYLESLEPSEKLSFIVKLLPFILPKVDKIDSESNEPNFPY